MENITSGHWVFAGIFMLAFIGYLIWSYRKDLGLHKKHYNGAQYVLLTLITVLFLIFIFKRIF